VEFGKVIEIPEVGDLHQDYRHHAAHVRPLCYSLQKEPHRLVFFRPGNILPAAVDPSQFDAGQIGDHLFKYNVEAVFHAVIPGIPAGNRHFCE